MVDKREIQSVYKCSLCRDTGWVTVREEGVRRSRRCPDCGRKKMVSRLMYDAGIPAAYSGMDLKLYNQGNVSQAEAAKRTTVFFENYPDVRRGLLYIGPCGVGKTHLSVALLKMLIMEKQVRGLFIDEAELLSRLQHSYNPDTQETEERILSRLKEADLLVWDDLGTGRPTEWAKSKISEVINHRYTNCKWTVMSSNYPMPARLGKIYKPSHGATLEERLGTRLFSRIMEMCESVEMDGVDARISIHKARLDFQDNNSTANGYAGLIPEAARTCPYCSDGAVKIESVERISAKGKSPRLDFFGKCTNCGKNVEGKYSLVRKS